MLIFFIVLGCIVALFAAFIGFLFLASGPEDEPEVFREDRNGYR